MIAYILVFLLLLILFIFFKKAKQMEIENNLRKLRQLSEIILTLILLKNLIDKMRLKEIIIIY